MAKRFVVTLSADGMINVETSNVQGEACLEDIETMQKLVPGAQIIDSRLTDDYFATRNTAHLAAHTIDELKETNE